MDTAKQIRNASLTTKVVVRMDSARWDTTPSPGGLSLSVVGLDRRASRDLTKGTPPALTTNERTASLAVTPNRGFRKAARQAGWHLSQLLLLLLLPVCLGLTSCTTAPSNFRSPDRTNLPAPVGLTGGAVEYRIQPFDTLQITVFQEPDLSVKSRVSAAGTINYPLLGAVAVAGLTGAEVERQLTSQLGKKYLVNPQVTILIEGSVNRRVTVLGQVKAPGTFDLPTDEPLRLLQAIARAGGFTDIAATDRVNVLRSEGGHEERVVINVAAIMRSGDHTQNIVLRPGDVVTVPETIF